MTFQFVVDKIEQLIYITDCNKGTIKIFFIKDSNTEECFWRKHKSEHKKPSNNNILLNAFKKNL